MADTLYTRLDDSLFHCLKDIRLLVCDVDGVFSDGRIYLGNNGEELKAFHTRDGYGVKALVNAGVDVAIITGRRSQIVENRMQALNVKHIIQGEEDKKTALQSLMTKHQYTANQVAAMGDDMPDTGMFELCTVRIAAADAHPQVKTLANWITTLPGGFGAVREVCDTLLQSRDQLSGIQAASI